MNTLTIHTDGAARGNPGPSAASFIARVGDQEIFQDSLYLGHQTNNTAEYQAVLLALKWLNNQSEVRSQWSNVYFFLDSKLVVEQLGRNWKIKLPHLQALHQQITTQIKTLRSRGVTKISFTHIPRSQNATADALANQCLDSQ